MQKSLMCLFTYKQRRVNLVQIVLKDFLLRILVIISIYYHVHNRQILVSSSKMKRKIVVMSYSKYTEYIFEWLLLVMIGYQELKMYYYISFKRTVYCKRYREIYELLSVFMILDHTDHERWYNARRIQNRHLSC